MTRNIITASIKHPYSKRGWGSELFANTYALRVISSRDIYNEGLGALMTALPLKAAFVAARSSFLIGLAYMKLQPR